MYLDDCVAAVKRWEGGTPWMYLDTVGIVTTAFGRALFSVQDVDALPWVIGFGGTQRRATYEEISAEYARVKEMPKGFAAGHYRGALYLSDADMESLLIVDVQKRDAALKAASKFYAAAPDAAKVALFDIAYEVGHYGLLHRFVQLDVALAAMDWAGCAATCHRAACCEARNEWTKGLFLEAAKAA